MTPILKTISIAALLASAAPLWAQTEATPSGEQQTQSGGATEAQPSDAAQGSAPAADAATDADAAQAGDTGTQPAADAPADAAPETSAAPAPAASESPVPAQAEGGDGVGETYVAESHGDWNVRCVRTAEGKDPCQLYQLLKDDRGNSVAEISLFGLPQNDKIEAGATIITPLETLLTEQLALSVDGGKENRYPFTFCAANGCYARVGFTTAEVAQFKRGNAAKMRIVPAAAPDQMIDLTISLSGFTAGYDAVNKANAATAN